MDDKQELLSDIAYNTEDEISISDKEDSSFEDILDIPHVVEESIDIDEYLKRGGECGRFQILISALLMISFLPMVIPVMTFYYIGIDPIGNVAKVFFITITHFVLIVLLV